MSNTSISFSRNFLSTGFVRNGGLTGILKGFRSPSRAPGFGASRSGDAYDGGCHVGVRRIIRPKGN
jgi:hypothetical protein